MFHIIPACMSFMFYSVILWTNTFLLLCLQAVQLQSDKSPSSASLVSPATLLGGEQMTFISRIPSPSLILHNLAHTCVFNGRQVIPQQGQMLESFIKFEYRINQKFYQI